MLSITALDENIWSRVAAGEVVERPASAVKELVENSLDAHAKRIRVSLKDGGRLRIVVEDDGTGIAFDELPLALAYHATSKISSLEDLEHIITLGYRGEALASLAAVADLELRSRQPDSESGGIIRTHDGKITAHIPANCPTGTRVQVDSLFSGLPARRKFLKSAAGELRRCAEFIREYAVCNPGIAFSLEHDGKNIFTSDGAGDRGKVLANIWDSGARIQTVSVKTSHTDLECWFQARAGLSGRGSTMAFVNGRAVSDPAVRAAVGKVSRELAGNWALFFTIEPSLVDVNIHPAKSEVRFRYEGEIYESVCEAAKHLGSPMTISEFFSLPKNPAPNTSLAKPAAKSSGGWNFSDSPSKIIAPQKNTDTFRNLFAVDDSKDLQEISDPDPEIMYIGQSSGGYLIYDDRESIILVDPHAAHERVNYERIKSQAESSRNIQKLLVPVLLHPTLALEAGEYERELKNAGFELENTPQGVELRAIPAAGTAEIEPEVLLRGSLQALRTNHDADTKSLLWRTWATMACKASVKLTTELSRMEALKLWRELRECEQPNVCPHGRPVMIELKNSDLLKRFGRE
ncbi:MAG: ATP-binding protein [Synergistaceae bacterium]|nr:ATP-binding protein [Synergistaceae bacterium]